MNVYNKTFFHTRELNEDIQSEGLTLLNMFGYSIQLVITGTPNVEFKLQGSADKVLFAVPLPPDIMANTWNDIQGSNATVTEDGIVTWNVTSSLYNFVRVVYTDASGGSSTATLNAKFNGKGV